MNSTSGTLLQEHQINEGIIISISEYQLCEAPQVSHSFNSEQNAMSKYESIKLSLYIDLTANSLITGINANYADVELALSSFKFLDIEHYNTEDNNWIKLVGIQENPQGKDSDMTMFHPEKFLRVNGYGVAKALRISFLALKKNLREHSMRTQVERGYNEHASRGYNPFNDSRHLKSMNLRDFDKGDYDVHADDEDEYEWKAFFSNCFSSLQIFGYSLYSSPTSSQVMPLLNITNCLKKFQRHEEAVESEILFGLALINARRFLQAAEILRRVSDYFATRHDQKKDGNKGRSNTPSSSRQLEKKDFLSTSVLNQTPNREGPSASLIRAAKIEIIISDAIVQHSMINRKVEALQKSCEYFMAQKDFLPSGIGYNYDIYTALLKLCPILSKLLLKCLNDKLEPLRISAIRTIEFLLDLLGSSMGPYLPQILKYVLLTYPNQSFLNLDSNRENFGMADLNPLDVPLNNSTKKDRNTRGQKGLSSLQPSQSDQAFANYKAMTDVYNHMLENFLNILPNISSQTLHVIFHDLILPNIFLPEITLELRSYFFRISERIINLCEGDLTVNVSFYANLLSILTANHIVLKNVGQKLWDAVKNKIIYNMESRAMDKFIDWVSESLYTLSESENRDDQVLLHFQYLLDLIAVICYREKHEEDDKAPSQIQKSQFEKKNFYIKDPINVKNLLNPLLIWLENIINNPDNKVELFRALWIVINELVLCLPKQQAVSINDIALPLLWRVCKYCETSSPTSGMLNFLITVLSSIKDTKDQMGVFLKEFTPIFANCVPHSIYDESFEVFDILMELSSSFLDEEMLKKCIMALLDLYTMKGKAYKQFKDIFIKRIIDHKQIGQRDLKNDLFYITLKICLLENPEPFESSEVQFTLLSTLHNQSDHHSHTLENKLNKKPFDSKQFAKLYEDFQDRLQFVDDVFRQSKDNNFPVLYFLISEGVLQSTLERLICSGNSKVRVKAMDILKSITEVFSDCKDFKLSHFKDRGDKNTGNIIEEASLTFAVPEFDSTVGNEGQTMFTTTKIVFCRFILNILKLSFDQFQDPKIQFYALALLAKVFDNFLPPPNVNEELERFNKTQKANSNKKVDLSELENLSCFGNFYMSYEDETYLHYRLSCILKFWPQVQSLVQSSWSNIKILSQTLISTWVKPDFTCYTQNYQKRLKSYLLTLLMNLLTSKEAELRYWGLMALGSLCGMNYNFDSFDEKLIENLSFFQRLSNTVSVAIWETVYNLQKDWNVSNKDAAVVLIQLAAPKEIVNHFYKLKKEGYALKYNNQAQGGQNTNEQQNKFNLTALSQFMTIKEGKHIPMPNYNEDSSLNFSHMFRNINANSTNSKYESPVDVKKSSGYQNQHPSVEKSHNLPELTSSNIIEDNQSEFRSIRSSLEDEDTDLFWLEYSPVETIKEALSLFRLDLKFPENYWVDKLDQSYNNNKSTTSNDEKEEYDKMFIEADEVDSPAGNYKIVGNPGLLQKLNKPGRPLEEEIDLEELGIIELEDDEDLIDEVEGVEQEMPKKYSKIRPESSGRNRATKVRPNSPQQMHTNEQIIQDYLAQNLKNINHDNYDYNDIRIEDSRSPNNMAMEKIALRPHNPLYRPLTPPLRNVTPLSNQRVNDQGYINFNKDYDNSGVSRANNKKPMILNDKNNFKMLRASPSAINLNLEGDNSQPGSRGISVSNSKMLFDHLEDPYFTNFEEEPGQLEGNVIFVNPQADGFKSPTQIIRSHNKSPDIFRTGKVSDDAFSFKGRSGDKSQHLSFGLGSGGGNMSSKEFLREQKSRYQQEFIEDYSPSSSNEQGLSARTNSPVGEMEGKGNEKAQVERKLIGKEGNLAENVLADNYAGSQKGKIKGPQGVKEQEQTQTIGKQKGVKEDKGQGNQNLRISEEQENTISLLKKKFGTLESMPVQIDNKRLNKESFEIKENENLSSEENPEQVNLLSQKYAHSKEPMSFNNHPYLEDYEDLSSNQEYSTQNFGSYYDQKPSPFTAPLNNNYTSNLNSTKGQSGIDHRDKPQPKSEGNSMTSLQVNQFNALQQKEQGASMKVKKKIEASHFSDYGQVANTLKENKRSSSNPKSGGSNSKRISERRKQLGVHASIHNYSSNTSTASVTDKSSPIKKTSLMKNILKKAVNGLSHEKDSHSFIEKHEKSIKKSQWYGNESMDAGSVLDAYGLLPKDKERESSNKRSSSVEKGTVKYFNVPAPIQRAPIDTSGKSGYKQGKLDKKTPKTSTPNMSSQRRALKGERVKDDRVFFPRKVTPLKNNRGSEYGTEVLEDISNQTM